MRVPSIQHIAAHMGGEVHNAREAHVPGPGHSAKDRSLSITLNEAGDDVLVHSFADDDAIACKDYVRDKLKMDTWQPNSGKGHATIDAMITRARGTSKPPVDFSAEAAATPAKDYDYTDASGKLIYQVRRSATKRFSQRRPDGTGDWINDLEGVKGLPYRLPELLKFPDATVFIVEGEKDCDRLVLEGLTATTLSGSFKWTNELAETFRGRDIVVLADNDTTGFKKAQAAAKALHGAAASLRMVLLPGLPDRGDVSDWLDAGNTMEQLVHVCLAAPLFDPAKACADVASANVLEPLPFIDTSSWSVEKGVPPREWGVQDIFPLRNVGLFSGEGATGKTLLTLQLGVAHALRRDWIGMVPEPGPFLYFGAEDETDEIHRRLADILCHYNADFSDLQGKVHLLTFAGEDALLGVLDRTTGIIKPTPLFERLLAAAIEIRPIMICLDTSADVFAGNEIDRSQVRQFISLLRKMAIAANAYVLVNSHPSLTGISTGSGLSGSTGWHNSVRARAYLTTAKTDKDEEPDPSLRLLEFKKSNYGPVSQSVVLRWEHGVFKPVAGIGSVDKMAAEQTADRLFVALLDRFNDQGRNVSEKSASKNYAPTVFGKEDESKKHGIKKTAFEGAMRRLFATSAIVVQPYGAPSRGTTRLVTR